MDQITCQPGPQTAFLESSADVVLFGGAAGGGKTAGLLLEAARHIDNPDYGAVIFRRTSPQITAKGSLWDTSCEFYPDLGARPREHLTEWVFESGATVQFRHLQHEKDRFAWKGSQVPLLAFDELSEFHESQFFYLLSRSRSACGIRPLIRATTNPVPEDDEIGGWLHRFIQWWIDPQTGLAIPERSGVIRYLVRIRGEIHWADTKQELIERFGDPELPEDHEDQPAQPKSFTFIPSKLSDNPALTSKDPGYRANLLMLPEHEKQQLLDGNWNAKLQAGMFFKVGRIQIVDDLPTGLQYCRAWDLAATEGAGDWTVGGKVGKDTAGVFYIADVRRGQWEADYRDNVIRQTAASDGRCIQRLPQDPAAAGKVEATRMVRMLAGHNVKALPISGDKATRATGFAAQVNAGNVRMLRAEWNNGLINRLDAFPTKGIAMDEIDALSDAFTELCTKKKLVVGI